MDFETTNYYNDLHALVESKYNLLRLKMKTHDAIDIGELIDEYKEIIIQQNKLIELDLQIIEQAKLKQKYNAEIFESNANVVVDDTTSDDVPNQEVKPVVQTRNVKPTVKPKHTQAKLKQKYNAEIFESNANVVVDDTTSDDVPNQEVKPVVQTRNVKPTVKPKHVQPKSKTEIDVSEVGDINSLNDCLKYVNIPINLKSNPFEYIRSKEILSTTEKVILICYYLNLINRGYVESLTKTEKEKLKMFNAKNDLLMTLNGIKYGSVNKFSPDLKLYLKL